MCVRVCECVCVCVCVCVSGALLHASCAYVSSESEIRQRSKFSNQSKDCLVGFRK